MRVQGFGNITSQNGADSDSTFCSSAGISGIFERYKGKEIAVSTAGISVQGVLNEICQDHLLFCPSVVPDGEDYMRINKDVPTTVFLAGGTSFAVRDLGEDGLQKMVTEYNQNADVSRERAVRRSS